MKEKTITSFTQDPLLRTVVFSPLHNPEPQSWSGLQPFAYWIVQALKPRVFVELGTHAGNSYFSFCQSIQENNIPTKSFAVDNWKGDAHSGLYDESVFEGVKLANQKYQSFSTLMRTTFDSAAQEFENKTIDLLHIDGLHTYKAVKHDFETWLPKMSDSGVILFHDTQVRGGNFGVHKLWSELKDQYKSFELIHSHGLGILCVSKKSHFLIPVNEPDRRLMIQFFTKLGDHILTSLSLEEVIASREEVIASREEVIDSLEDVMNSRSWRLTSPLRAFIRKLESIKRNNPKPPSRGQGHENHK